MARFDVAGYAHTLDYCVQRFQRFNWTRYNQSKQITGRTNMAKRTSSAVWEGNLREGKGKVKLGSGAFEGQYSFASRFEEGTGTNPEELIGARMPDAFRWRWQRA